MQRTHFEKANRIHLKVVLIRNPGLTGKLDKEKYYYVQQPRQYHLIPLANIYKVKGNYKRLLSKCEFLNKLV